MADRTIDRAGSPLLVTQAQLNVLNTNGLRFGEDVYLVDTETITTPIFPLDRVFDITAQLDVPEDDIEVGVLTLLTYNNTDIVGGSPWVDILLRSDGEPVLSHSAVTNEWRVRFYAFDGALWEDTIFSCEGGQTTALIGGGVDVQVTWNVNDFPGSWATVTISVDGIAGEPASAISTSGLRWPIADRVIADGATSVRVEARTGTPLYDNTETVATGDVIKRRLFWNGAALVANAPVIMQDGAGESFEMRLGADRKVYLEELE